MTVADMTTEDLKKFVEDTIDERLTRLLGNFEEAGEADETDYLTWDEVRALVDRSRWTPPADAPSSFDLLREDRDG